MSNELTRDSLIGKQLSKDEFEHFCIIKIAQARTGRDLDVQIPKEDHEILFRYIIEHEKELWDEYKSILSEFKEGIVRFDVFIEHIKARYPRNAVMAHVAGTDPSKPENWVETSIPASHVQHAEREVAIKKIVANVTKHGKINLIKEDDGNLVLGQLAVIRSCSGADPDDATLGIFVGSVLIRSDLFGISKNPVFYVPKLKKTIAGYESWWKAIPKADDGLSCDAMRAKYSFTWEDVKQGLNAELKRMGLDLEVKRVQ